MTTFSPLNLLRKSTDYLNDMPEKRSFLGSWWNTIFFSLLLMAAGIAIGYDIRGSHLPQKSEPGQKQPQTSEISPSQIQVQVKKLDSSLQDSIKVIKAQAAQMKVATPKPPPGLQILEPTLVPAGQSKSLLRGKVLLSVAPNPYNDNTEVEVILRRTTSPIERALEYGEVIRLFYAHTGRQESFMYQGVTYYIDCLAVGKFGDTMGLKFALYEQ